MQPVTNLRVDMDRAGTEFSRFWRSTGFSPAELLLEPEMRQTLAYVGGVPNRGIEFLRVHYMLDLVTAQRFGHYDWSRLDRALEVMVEHRLKPFFELMGNPSYLFTDFNNRDQAYHWRDFVTALAERYRDRFSADEIQTWYFETWNEPDIWWTLGGEAGFNNYYDACSEGLRAVDPALRFGGPGVARRLPPIFKSLLAHCDTGENFFTGETGVRIDFISVHEKGARKHVEDLTPNSLSICRHEMMAVDYVRQNHPRFASLPFINNECDPQIGWHIPHTWHAMPYFAALAAKIIDQHQRILIDREGVNYGVLSNDNGFIGRWGQRTHLCYFGQREILAAQAEHRTDISALDARIAAPKPFELVKKPALSAMELMALLGEERLAVKGDALDPDMDGLGALATRLPDGAAVLLYNSVDRIWVSGTRSIRVAFDSVRPGTYAIATFRIQSGMGDPFTVWEELGGPDIPAPDELDALRAAQEPELSIETIRVGGNHRPVERMLELALPGIALVALIERSASAPKVPTQLTVRHYPGLNDATNAVLFWQGEGQGSSIELFDVLWSPDQEGPYEVVNPSGLLSSVFVHRLNTVPGYYRVRSRDLFGRTSELSSAVSGRAEGVEPGIVRAA
jgi:L-iduronidase